MSVPQDVKRRRGRVHLAWRFTLVLAAVVAPTAGWAQGSKVFKPGLAELKEGGRDGILIVQSGATLNIPGRSLEVATSNSLPTMYPASFWTRFGALISYGPDQHDQGRQGARLAHKILTGTPPRELPVELPERIDFVVNLKTAKRLGLQIPQAVLLRADRVIR